MSDLIQWLVFTVSFAALISLIEFDFGRAFRREFMLFSPNDVLSAQWLSVFIGPLKLRRYAALILWTRYFCWHVIVVVSLLVVGFAAVKVPAVGVTIKGLLPHFFQAATEANGWLNGAELAQVGVVALLLFLVIRLPGDLPKESREELARRTTELRKILSSYGRFRDLYIHAYILKGAYDRCRTDIRRDIQKNRLCERHLTKAVRKELFTNLLNECAQPTSAQEHQILMGYIDAKGAIALDTRLRTAKVDVRQEIRRPTHIPVTLKSFEDDKTYSAHVRDVGIINQRSLNSFGLSDKCLTEIPDGEYMLTSVAGKKRKNKQKLGVDLRTRIKGRSSKISRKYGLIRPPSPKVGRAYRRHILAQT